VKAIRDRIIDLRRVPARELVPHPRNWRRHPKSQRKALEGVLSEIGYAGALLARETSDGRLMLIDGHLRAETTPDQEVPVLVLDVTEAEADKILLTLDPLAAMADADAEALRGLLADVSTEDDAVREMLAALVKEPPTSPNDFQSIDENLAVNCRCPKCGYEWSDGRG
jgi:hypothetical protein